MALEGCGEPPAIATPAEKRLLRQIQQAPDARVLLCDSAGSACDQRRDSAMALCLADRDCQLYTVRKNQWPWLWQQLSANAHP